MKWRMPFLIISLPLHMPNCLSLSLSLSSCLHTLLPHLAWAVVAAIVAPRPQDERSSRPRLPRFRSRRCQQDDLSCSRFYLFVFIIQQNQLRLHPVTPPPCPFPLPCLSRWHGRGCASTPNWLASSVPSANLPQLACTVASSRLLLVMTAMST